MSLSHYLKRGVSRLAPLIAILCLASLVVASPAQAEGGLALSGNFYRKNLEIPQGASVSGSDIYVVVFNQSDGELSIRMTTEPLVGISITLSQQDFTLPAGSNQQVFIGVEVSQDAAPADYEISVTAESYTSGTAGIQIAGAASQTAKLTVLGESGSVKVQLLTPEGQPLVSTVRLYRVIDGENYEIAYSETGTLETKVAPGNFIAVTYAGGEKQEESFTVAAGEEKTISLSVATIYFEDFTVVPNYHRDTGELAFANIAYTVSNQYKLVDEATVILEVSRDGTEQEPIPLANLKPLDKGRVGLNYSYIPSDGWVDGTYSFRLSLMLDGKPYATTLEDSLDVNGGLTPSGEDPLDVSGGLTPKGGSPLAIGGITAGALVIVGVGVLVWRRRRA